MELSSGNVFADLGLPNPELLLLKSGLVQHLRGAIGANGLTPRAAANRLELPVADLRKLLDGAALTKYSVDRLVKYVVRLGGTVELTVRPPAKAG